MAVIVDIGGNVLLQRRAIELGEGKLTFQPGYVDRGEVMEEAASRDVLEEAGVHVAIDGLAEVYSGPSNPVVLVVYYVWAARTDPLLPGEKV